MVVLPERRRQTRFGTRGGRIGPWYFGPVKRLALAVLLFAALLPGAAARAETPRRTVSLTFDDLPLVPPADLTSAQRVTAALLQALTEHRAPAAGFVNEDKVHIPGEMDERIALLERWLEIPQILLLHANEINADCLDEMLDRLEARGYAFVSLEEAVRDPAYRTPDEYVGRNGPSWLHRWRVTLGQPSRLRDEPDLPDWALRAYQELR